MVYPGALWIDGAAPAVRVEHALQRLLDGSAPVLLGDGVALRVERGWLRCEAIDPAPGARRCAVEYEVLLENAQRALEASPLASRLPPLPRRWAVVELRDDAVVTAWPRADD